MTASNDRDELVIEAIEASMSDEELGVPSEDELRKAEHDRWLRTTRNCYRASTDYLDSSIRKQWEKNLAHWRNQHAPGSRYHNEQAKGRSKLFRPKTRSAMRTYEATAAIALFTNPDLVVVTPGNASDQMQYVSAKINQSLLQNRLARDKRKWFLTAIGAYQDTQNYGVCIGKAYWDYQSTQDVAYTPVFDEAGNPVLDDDGAMLGEELVEERVVRDRLEYDLLAPENFRFDPNCDWRDPAGTSPYLQELIPMYIGDVQQRMASGNWHRLELGEIATYGRLASDTEVVRQAREGSGRQDPQNTHDANEFTQVWVLFNIVEREGRDWAYYTLGTDHMLTDPVPLEELFPHGRDLYTIGYSTLEAHRNYPAGVNELAAPLQEEVNDLANQRMDNVKLVLNKRYFLRRGADTDLNALMRNTPGGGVMIRDPINDVRVIDTPDITSSSYAEQDRLNVELDDILGTFSQSSVQSNRSLNETVGGMDLMKSGANVVQEYALSCWILTWVEPMLNALMKLEQRYETDQDILATVTADLQLYQRFGVDQITDELLQQNVTAQVNVGMGNTDPLKRVEKLMLGIRTAGEMGLPVDPDQVGQEIFASLGFGDGKRFLLSEEKQQQIAQQPKPPTPEEVKLQMKQMELEAEGQSLQLKMQLAQQEQQFQIQRLQLEREIAMARLEVERANRVGDQQTKFAIEQLRDKTRRDSEAGRLDTALAEMNLKRRMGSGI